VYLRRVKSFGCACLLFVCDSYNSLSISRCYIFYIDCLACFAHWCPGCHATTKEMTEEAERQMGMHKLVSQESRRERTRRMRQRQQRGTTFIALVSSSFIPDTIFPPRGREESGDLGNVSLNSSLSSISPTFLRSSQRHPPRPSFPTTLIAHTHPPIYLRTAGLLQPTV